MTLFLLGATGKTGTAVLVQSLERGHLDTIQNPGSSTQTSWLCRVMHARQIVLTEVERDQFVHAIVGISA
jgi:hypothetical protein